MRKNIPASLILIITMIAPVLSFSQSAVEITKPEFVRTWVPVTTLEAGIENTVHITVNDQAVKRLLVNTDGGSVRQKGEDFIVCPKAPGKLILKIYNYNDLSNPVLIEEREMQVVAPPFAALAGKHGGKISLEELKKVSKVELVDSRNSEKVNEFKLSVAGTGIEYAEYNSKNENLTGEMIARLQSLSPGCKIFVEYIRAGKPDGSPTRYIAPLSFVVSE